MQIHKVLLKEIMVEKPFTIDVHEDLAVAWDIFRLHKINHLPILINDRLLTGMLTLFDLYRTISPKKTESGKLLYDVNELNRFKVQDVMAKEVISLSPESYLGQAIDIMIKHKIGSIPVVNETRYLEGLVTRSLVLQTVAKFFT